MKSIERYYQEQLEWLRNAGQEFVDANPQLKTTLRGEEFGASDPHVDRILEGAAFFAARIQRELDGSLLKLADDVLSICYPNLLEPQPAMSLVRFEPKPSMSSVRVVEPGARLVTERALGSPRVVEVEVADRVEVSRFIVSRVETAALGQGERSRLDIHIAQDDGEAAGKLENIPSRLSITPFWMDLSNACELYAGMVRSEVRPRVQVHTADGAVVDVTDRVRVRTRPPEEFAPVLDSSPDLFPGIGLLREFMAMPHRFVVLDVEGLNTVEEMEGATRIHVTLELETSIRRMPSISPANLLTNTACVINRWHGESRQIQYDGSQVSYPIVPDRRGGGEVVRVDRVEVLKQGDRSFQEIPAFDYFDRERSSYVVRREARNYTNDRIETRWWLELQDLDAKGTRYKARAHVVGCDADGTDVLTSAQSLANREGMSQDLACKTVGLPSRFAPTAVDEAEYWSLVDILSTSILHHADFGRLRRFLSHLNRSRNPLSTAAIRSIEHVEIESRFTTIGHEPRKVFFCTFLVRAVGEVPATYWPLFFRVLRSYLRGLLPINCDLAVSVRDHKSKSEIISWKPTAEAN